MAENSMGWVLTKERLPEKDGEYFCITRIPQKDPNNDIICKNVYHFATKLKNATATDWRYSGYTKKELNHSGFFSFTSDLDPYIIPNIEAWLDGVPTYEVKRGISDET